MFTSGKQQIRKPMLRSCFILDVVKHCQPERSLTSIATRHATPLPSPPNIHALVTPEHTAEARLWISQFQRHTIPKAAVRFTFSRSSGPGGQVSAFEKCLSVTRSDFCLAECEQAEYQSNSTMFYSCSMDTSMGLARVDD
jgi:hypothetical protein